jgi:hypothetical protein
MRTMLAAWMPLPYGPGSQTLNSGWPISKAGRTELGRIGDALAAAGAPPEAFRARVLAALARADRRLIAGIAAYRRHPYARDLPAPPTAWAEGGTRIVDYGGEGLSVLFVPSLVNRAEVLDLMPDASLLRWLAGNGAHPLLLDWGWPGEAERSFTLTDYVAGRLERALAALPGPVVLVGYCMGGLLALAAALRQPDRIRALGLLPPSCPGWSRSSRSTAPCRPTSCRCCSRASTPSASPASFAPSPRSTRHRTGHTGSSRWRIG